MEWKYSTGLEISVKQRSHCHQRSIGWAKHILEQQICFMSGYTVGTTHQYLWISTRDWWQELGKVWYQTWSIVENEWEFWHLDGILLQYFQLHVCWGTLSTHRPCLLKVISLTNFYRNRWHMLSVLLVLTCVIAKNKQDLIWYFYYICWPLWQVIYRTHLVPVEKRLLVALPHELPIRGCHLSTFVFVNPSFLPVIMSFILILSNLARLFLSPR